MKIEYFNRAVTAIFKWLLYFFTVILQEKCVSFNHPIIPELYSWFFLSPIIVCMPKYVSLFKQDNTWAHTFFTYHLSEAINFKSL